MGYDGQVWVNLYIFASKPSLYRIKSMQIINIDWCTVSLYILCGESRELFIHCGAVILSFVRVCRVLNVKDFDFDVCTEVCMINEVDRRKHVYKTIEL